MARATGSRQTGPYWLALLAEAYAGNGQVDLALLAIAEAVGEMTRTGARFWEPELHRLKGEILLERDGFEATSESEACFLRAIEVARVSTARSWELRAATSLARVWCNQGRQAEGRGLLAPIYGWFTEGLNTRDLVQARALLDAQ